MEQLKFMTIKFTNSPQASKTLYIFEHLSGQSGNNLEEFVSQGGNS